MATTPLVLWLELTEACQYKCRFCYNYWRDAPPAGHAHMSGAVARDVADFVGRCAQSYPTSVALAGGDPTAHPDFVNIANAVAEAAADVTVVTHGGGLSASALAALSRLPNLAIQFSIPSLDPERHRFLTGNGQIDRVMTALMMCRRLGIPVSLSVVLTSLNKGDLNDLVHLAAEVSADYMIVNRFLASGRGAHYDEQFTISADDFDAAVDAARDIAREAGVRLLRSGFDPHIRDRKAAEPKLTVSVNGDLRLCSLVPDSIATLRADPADLVARSVAYWKSRRPLEGCYCAAQGAAQPAVEAATA